MECKRDSFNGALGGARETHWEYVSHCLKSMWNNTFDNKTCNLNFSIPFDLSDESRERSSLSYNFAEPRSRLFSKRSTVAEKFTIAKLVLSLLHPYTFHILRRRSAIILSPTFSGSVDINNCYGPVIVDSTVSINCAVGSYLLLPRKIQPPE